MSQSIAVIGGDARYLELIRQMQLENNMVLVGYDQLEQSYTGLEQIELNQLNVKDMDAVILPVRGIGNAGEIDAVFSSQKIHLEKAWFQSLNKGTKIFTGIANDYLKTACEAAELELVTLMDRDDVAIYNSIPTAEGTVMMAIENTDFTIHQSKVTVVGFGRVGVTVARVFQALGAQVRVCSRSDADLARITESGARAITYTALAQTASDTDILINTVPAQVVDASVIRELPSHAVILDLASKPGGTDFEYAEKRGIKAKLAKSLPGIVAPKTSGKILAEVIKQALKLQQKGAEVK